MVWCQLCEGCWVLLLEGGSACLGQCSCLSHRKGKQTCLVWCEITCTAQFCSAVFVCAGVRNKCVCGVAFSVNGVIRVCALALVGGEDTRCPSGCHCLLMLLGEGLAPSNQLRISGNEWLHRRPKVKASVTVKVTPGDRSRPAAVGSVFWALAVTLDVHGWTVRAADNLQKSWVDAWPLTLFNSGFFFSFLRRDRDAAESSQLQRFSDPYLKVF